MMEQKNQNDLDNQWLTQDELNIFSEFSWEVDFWDQKVSLNKEVEKKDLEYYLKLTSNILLWLNIVWILLTLIFFSYFKVQNSETQFDKSYLNLFCPILLWEDSQNIIWVNCSSTKALLVNLSTEIENLSNNTVTKLNSLIWDVYSLDNFINTKEVEFLLEKKNDKTPVLEILNDFDKMKNYFLDWDKKAIDCKNIEIQSGNLVKFECYSYSSDWDMNIKSNLWNKVQWTSITLAASFLNFIENNPIYNFKIIEKQTDFTSESLIWEWNYVKSTKFSFVLQYNNIKNTLNQ